MDECEGLGGFVYVDVGVWEGGLGVWGCGSVGVWESVGGVCE